MINPVEKFTDALVEKLGVANTLERTIVKQMENVGDAGVDLAKSLLEHMVDTMGRKRESH